MMTGDKLYPLGDTDYAVPPGETLRELLDEKGMSQRELARRADLSPKHVNKLLAGLVPLSADVAMRLERVTGTPARIWNRLEAGYRSDQQRIRARRELSGDVMWADGFPVAELVQRDYLPEQPADKVSRVEQLFAFFGVASVGAWDEVYSELTCAFRTTQALIQLSLRYKSDDHLWFTVFHEIGHVLRHGKTDVWIEASSSSGADDPREAEADKFFRETLIPPRDARELPRLKSDDQVREFADRLGIAPGIVVGRLQHDGIWPQSRGNNLKRRLTFDLTGDDSLPCP